LFYAGFIRNAYCQTSGLIYELHMKRAFLLLALILSAPALPPAAADTMPEVQTSRFSEKPVPRFETLRFSRVNGRAGPGTDQQEKWVYTLKGLPMLVLKETTNWYFVQDPAGEKVWISASQFNQAANALTLGSFTLKAGRAADSADVAHIGEGILVELGPCDATQCQIRADRYRGWAPRELLWGATATKG